MRVAVGAERDRFYSLYLRAKNICRQQMNLAKKQANMLKIENAHNRCKATWNLVNQTYKCKPAMKCTTSPDEFNNFILNEVDQIVSSVITSDDSVLKISRTIPIFKSISSYRPISLVPALAKVSETVMTIQLVDHIERNNLFSESQHEFRGARSTVTAVSHVSLRIPNVFEERGATALILVTSAKLSIVCHMKWYYRSWSSTGGTAATIVLSAES
ncbi:hypothetical protein J6590_061602 [Homalodisca vitripennis]|nr:hypothetical protein J6590_061602 [Homalodisca vitripennis]